VEILGIKDWFFKTKVGNRRYNTSWKKAQIEALLKEKEKEKANIEILKNKIHHCKGKFEELEIDLMYWVNKLKKEDIKTIKEYENYIIKVNTFLAVFNKLIDFEVESHVTGDQNPKLNQLREKEVHMKAELLTEWERIDQRGSESKEGAKWLESFFDKRIKTTQPLIRKSVTNILKKFEDIEGYEKKIKVKVQNIDKINKKVKELSRF
jgi:hypothetical protein